MRHIHPHPERVAASMNVLYCEWPKPIGLWINRATVCEFLADVYFGKRAYVAFNLNISAVRFGKCIC